MLFRSLGTYLSCKLTTETQLSFIDRKSGHLFTRLFPYLQSASADARRDAFLTFVNPLFMATTILMESENSKALRNRIVLLRKKWFKKFLRISKSTSTWLMDQMLNIDFIQLIHHHSLIADLKLQARLQGTVLDQYARIDSGPNPLRGVPNIWSSLVNTIKRPCPVCRGPKPMLSRWHLMVHHNIKLPAIEYI